MSRDTWKALYEREHELRLGLERLFDHRISDQHLADLESRAREWTGCSDYRIPLDAQNLITDLVLAVRAMDATGVVKP